MAIENGHNIMPNVKKVPHSSSPGAGAAKKCRSFKYPPPTPWHWHCYCTLHAVYLSLSKVEKCISFVCSAPFLPFFLLCAAHQNSLFNYSSHCLSALILNDVAVSGALFCNKEWFHQTHPFTRWQSASKYFVPIIPFQQCGKSDQCHCLIIYSSSTLLWQYTAVAGVGGAHCWSYSDHPTLLSPLGPPPPPFSANDIHYSNWT